MEIWLLNALLLFHLNIKISSTYFELFIYTLFLTTYTTVISFWVGFPLDNFNVLVLKDNFSTFQNNLNKSDQHFCFPVRQKFTLASGKFFSLIIKFNLCLNFPGAWLWGTSPLRSEMLENTDLENTKIHKTLHKFKENS